MALIDTIAIAIVSGVDESAAQRPVRPADAGQHHPGRDDEDRGRHPGGRRGGLWVTVEATGGEVVLNGWFLDRT